MKLFFLFCTLFSLYSLPTLAVPHLDLDVTINIEERKVTVQGTSSEPVQVPGQSMKQTRFNYSWAMTAPQPWQGGDHLSEKGLFLSGTWAPQSDGLFTYTLKVSSPWVTVAPGAISDEVFSPGAYQARFSMDKPTDGVPLFAGPYKIGQLAYKKVTLRTYFYDDMEDMAQDYLQRTAQYLERFEAEIGPYPFAGFHIVAAPVPAGYGFAGLTYMGARVLRLPFIKETSLGHEILHNYWGNGVFPDYSSGNWAEGLTTYMADYMTAEARSTDKARDMRLNWLREFAALPDAMDKPVTSFKGKHSQASQVIGYHKVAFIFHMLRREVGDAAFFNALQDFWQTHAFKTADWSDLEASFSKFSQRNLRPFFNQWVHQKGAPTFKNLSAQARYKEGEGWAVNARVFQTSPVYDVNLPLAIGTGQDVIEGEIAIKGSMAQNEFWIAQRPMAISLDPDFNIFRKLGTNEAPPIIKDVTLASEVRLDVTDKSLTQSATALAQRMVDGTLKTTGKGLSFILVGTHESVERELKKRHLPTYQFEAHDAVTAKVWAGKMQNSTPYMVISVKNPAALDALMRPLPHYGARSALLFAGRKAIFKFSGHTRPLSVPIN